MTQKKLGQILINSMSITEKQLNEGIEIQKNSHFQEKLGAILKRLGHITQHDLDHALNLQFQSELEVLWNEAENMRKKIDRMRDIIYSTN